MKCKACGKSRIKCRERWLKLLYLPHYDMILASIRGEFGNCFNAEESAYTREVK